MSGQSESAVNRAVSLTDDRERVVSSQLRASWKSSQSLPKRCVLVTSSSQPNGATPRGRHGRGFIKGSKFIGRTKDRLSRDGHERGRLRWVEERARVRRVRKGAQAVRTVAKGRIDTEHAKALGARHATVRSIPGVHVGGCDRHRGAGVRSGDGDEGRGQREEGRLMHDEVVHDFFTMMTLSRAPCVTPTPRRRPRGAGATRPEPSELSNHSQGSTHRLNHRSPRSPWRARSLPAPRVSPEEPRVPAVKKHDVILVAHTRTEIKINAPEPHPPRL